MKLFSITLFIALLGSIMTCASVWAQATAQISGTVRDQSGAVLPGVEVTAAQTETSIARTAVSNETGSFVLPNLPLGPYKLEAALTGFRTFVQTGIVLQVNSSPAINPVLQVGQVTEQVEVQANAAQVETRSTAVGEVIETQRILELPLPARNVTNLITLTGGASQGGAGSVPGGFVRGTSAATNYVSVGGGLYFGVMYALDGAMHNDAYDNSQIPFPFPDALQEFKVDASGVGAVSMLSADQDDCGKVIYNIPLRPNEYQIVQKVDYQQSAKHSIFERYIVTRYSNPHPYDTAHNLLSLNTTDGGNEDLAHGFAVGSTYLVSPNTINAFRVGMTRVIVGRPGIRFFGPSDIGVNAYTYSPGNMVLVISGGFQFNTRGVYAHNVSNAYNINDDVNLVRGNHQITFGGNVSEYKVYQRCLVSGQGQYTFNGNGTGTGNAPGLAMADFLIGRLNSLMQVSAVLWSSRQTYVASYLQDVWKMSPRVTLTYGVRWEPFLPLAVGYGQGAKLNEGGSFQFSQDRFNRGIRSTIYTNAPVA